MTTASVVALALRLLSCACMAYAAAMAMWQVTDRVIERLG